MIQIYQHSPGPSGMLRVGAVTLLPGDDLQTYREKLARIVLDGLYQFVGLLDADGITLEINHAALDGAGLALEAIAGKPFWDARWFQVSRETGVALRDYVRRARSGEFVRCDLEVYGQAAGEQTIIVDFSLLPIRDDGGRVVFLLAEGRNISEKKLIEAEVARKNTELQALLDQVRQLDRLKSDLFANVSHELRTPLALIMGPVEQVLADSANLTEAQRRQLAIVHRNGAALLKHVNDLLDLAKVDARKMDLHFVRTDLAATVRGVAEQFHAVAPRNALNYVVSVPDELPAEVDVEKIERVLLNLLSNAFKFTPSGGWVRCTLERTGRGRALICVQDSGPGVPPEMRRAVFERFRQGQEGTTRDFTGTGLGLAIAKEFIELHGGTIGVTSAPGGGALFQVEIPLRAPPGAFVAAPQPEPVPPREAVTEGVFAELPGEDGAAPGSSAADARPTVLVVEDNVEMRNFVRNVLQDEYRVAVATDGQQALECALASAPDLVVTDLMLPRLGGDRLVEEMRARPSLVDVPVLVLSAKDDDALRARLLAESVQDYVTKPFSAHELRARVRNLMAVKLTRDALRGELASQADDLTELTRRLIASRHALRESVHRWWSMYEHSPVGIALVEAGGQIRSANAAFCSMLRYTGDELANSALQRIIPVEERASAMARIGELLSGQLRDHRLQRRFQRKDGALIWANTSVSVVPGTAEESQLVVVVAEDVTERKLAEQALMKTQNELARVSRVTTLGELAASIAHEVNQPLAAIVANGQACQRWLDAQPPNEQEARVAVRRIVRDANRAGEIIARIRGFLSRGEVRHEPVDLDVLVGDVFALVRHEAQNLHVTLRREAVAGLPAASGDRVQVQQVVLNLVMNALEAMARATGPRVLDVSLREEGADAIRVDVRDSGIGLDQATGDRVFDAFHTTKSQGMGMGLAISRSIVEAHGGRLWFTPNEGAGVTFSFTLPRAHGGAGK